MNLRAVIISLSIVITILIVGVVVWTKNTNNPSKEAAPQTATETQQSMSTGEIQKINKEQSEITIKHGEIKNLGMPPMTMTFRVSDPTMIDKLQVGQQINFMAENVNGELVVTKINLVP